MLFRRDGQPFFLARSRDLEMAVSAAAPAFSVNEFWVNGVVGGVLGGIVLIVLVYALFKPRLRISPNIAAQRDDAGDIIYRVKVVNRGFRSCADFRVEAALVTERNTCDGRSSRYESVLVENVSSYLRGRRPFCGSGEHAIRISFLGIRGHAPDSQIVENGKARPRYRSDRVWLGEKWAGNKNTYFEVRVSARDSMTGVPRTLTAIYRAPDGKVQEGVFIHGLSMKIVSVFNPRSLLYSGNCSCPTGAVGRDDLGGPDRSSNPAGAASQDGANTVEGNG